MAEEADELIQDEIPAEEPRELSVMDDVREAMAELQARGPSEEAPAEDVSLDEDPPASPAPSEDPITASLDRWSPVMEQLGIDRAAAVDNYMSAVVSLQQDPVGTLTQLARTYLPADKAQQAIAAMAASYNVDPLDVDVEQYRAAEPARQQNAELAQLRARLFSMELDQLRSSGEYPLLSDPGAAKAIADTMGRYSDLTVPQAYALAVHSNPDLSVKHSQAVAGSKEQNAEPPADREAARATKLRRARAADLPKGAAGDQIYAPTGNSILDDVRAAAAEIGFGR